MHEGKVGEKYNIATGEELKNIQVISMILQLVHRPENLIQFVKDRPGHDMRYSLDTGKIRGLGWKPKTRFQEGIKKAVDWYQQNEEWWKPILESGKIDFHE